MPIEPKTAVINPGKLEGLQDKRSSDSVPSADHRSPRPPSSADPRPPGPPSSADPRPPGPPSSADPRPPGPPSSADLHPVTRPASSADLPPVSRLLDELKHFDREKNLRKVKIEISLESGGGWEQGRRLSDSSLEVTEAARHGGDNFKYGPDHYESALGKKLFVE